MQLPGHLGLTTLGDLLGTLYRASATGTLELVENRGVTSGRRHRIAFRRGLVSEVDTPLPVDRLGDILQREGFVSRDTLRSAASACASGAKIGESLLESSAVSTAALTAALRHQLRRRLDRLFAIREALVHFRVPRPERATVAAVPLSPHEFLAGRPRMRTSKRKSSTGASAAARMDPKKVRALGALGLSLDADSIQIQRAFRSLAAQVHPDRHPAASEPERRELLQRFAALSAAYHVLQE
jgi:hypothetical protein